MSQREAALPPERNPPEPPFLISLPSVRRAPDTQSLTVEPARAWFTTLGGVSKHILGNQSEDRLALKVRCSNNHAFRVNPVFFFLSRGETQNFEIIRLNGGNPRKDKVQLLFTIARERDDDPERLFRANAMVRSVVLPITTI